MILKSELFVVLLFVTRCPSLRQHDSLKIVHGDPLSVSKGLFGKGDYSESILRFSQPKSVHREIPKYHFDKSV